jgi:hypothetical protein
MTCRILSAVRRGVIAMILEVLRQGDNIGMLITEVRVVPRHSNRIRPHSRHQTRP